MHCPVVSQSASLKAHATAGWTISALCGAAVQVNRCAEDRDLNQGGGHGKRREKMRKQGKSSRVRSS
jgi:hypothetical protein